MLLSLVLCFGRGTSGRQHGRQAVWSNYTYPVTSFRNAKRYADDVLRHDGRGIVVDQNSIECPVW
jgi:hypothetical protein